ncbi:MULTISPECIES: hypothetical protein [Pseudomonas]|uniref:hypothetical protein n=1 Tax=Pseudomonas TaxID=286 RepID=UPI000E6C1E0C|nr:MULTISPECIES: hypothetical protein [unclassified Pseudomonas]MBK3509658.1 hypothetical protein [Pseudomonas sp. MF6747]
MPAAKKKQAFGFSCGAASLLCAAVELGGTLPAGLTATDALRTNMCEVELYKITSGAITGGVVKPFDPTKAGYSYPHNVALAARSLGLNVTIYMDGFLATALSVLYPQCEEQCIKAGFPVIHGKPPTLAANRRALIVVTTFLIGLHYVMERPGGGYMDPNDGEDFADFKAMNGVSKAYGQTGITLVLEREVVV